MIRSVLILMLGTVWQVAGASPVTATESADHAPVANTMCPVLTDEAIDPDISITYQNKTIYFCCPRCRRKFEQTPQQYLGALPQFASTSEHGHDDSGDPAQAPHDHATGHGSARKSNRLVTFAGKFHPVMVHFPIALLLGALAAELCFMFTGATWFSHAARFSVLAGAGGAVVAASLGWANAAYSSISADIANTLTWHRWLGVATVVAGVVAAGLSEISRRKHTPTSRGAYVIALVIAALLVAVTGHFGGTLVFGSEYFTW